jgi:hypothetical protein
MSNIGRMEDERRGKKNKRNAYLEIPNPLCVA